MNDTAAVGSKCGFSLQVTADGSGPQTLALFGSASLPLSVTAKVKAGPIVPVGKRTNNLPIAF